MGKVEIGDDLRGKRREEKRKETRQGKRIADARRGEKRRAEERKGEQRRAEQSKAEPMGILHFTSAIVVLLLKPMCLLSNVIAPLNKTKFELCEPARWDLTQHGTTICACM